MGQQPVLSIRIRGVWELETSKPELLQWLLSLDAAQNAQPHGSRLPSS